MHFSQYSGSRQVGPFLRGCGKTELSDIGSIFVFVDVVSTSLEALVDKFGSGLSVDVVV